MANEALAKRGLEWMKVWQSEGIRGGNYGWATILRREGLTEDRATEHVEEVLSTGETNGLWAWIGGEGRET